MKLIQELKKLFHHYVVFTKSIFFVLVLIFGYKLVENTLLNILITHLTDAWGEDEYDLRKAAMVVNLQEGTCAVSVVFLVYVADVLTGRFIMVIFATAFCIAGLFLNFLASINEYDEKVKLVLLYLGMGLLTFAQAALSVTLEAFLDDQLRQLKIIKASLEDQLTNVNEDQRKQYTNFWLKLVSFVAAIFSLFEPLKGLEFGMLAGVLAAVMWFCFLVFLWGTEYYNHDHKIENKFKDVGIVIFRALWNMNAKYPQGNDTQIPPHVWWLRGLDKAAIAHGTETSGCSHEQVKTVKQLFKMLPMWWCFLTLSLVVASGSTFFFEQVGVIDNNTLIDNDNRYLVLANVVRLTNLVGSVSSSYLIWKLRMQFKQQKMELVKIGMGMLCCVSCCIVAWKIASLGRSYYINYVYWLIPQFILLGLMQGLSEDGLESFYASQAPKSLLNFGPPFGELVMGIGKFMSIPCVLIFSTTSFRWFEKDIDASRLDKYYIFLAVLSFLNFMLYCCFGWWCYGNDAFLEGVQPIDGITLDEVVVSRPVERQHISGRSLSHRSSKGKESGCGEAGDATADRPGIGEKGEAETHEDPLLGSTDQSTTRNTSEHVSHRSVSKPRESSCGDVSADGEEAEEAETHEDPLLGSSEQSTSNTTVNIHLWMRVVTAISRLFSRAARKRSNSKNE